MKQTASPSIIVCALVGATLVAACDNSYSAERPPNADSLRAEVARENEAEKVRAAAQARVDAEELRSDRAALDSLKRRFKYDVDEIRGGGSYKPRAMEWVGGTRLTCSVKAAGLLQLQSVYAGNDAIFHNRVVARIGNSVVETQIVRALVPGLGPQVLRTGTVFEMGFYDEGSEDGGLIRALAAADSDIIRVRLEGDAGVHDFVLSDRSRRVIRDCVRLADLIRLVRR